MTTIPIKQRFFQLIDNDLYCFNRALEEAGLSTNYYNKERSRGNNRLRFIDHPENRKYSLVAFETLSDEHKYKIRLRFENPYDFVVREPIATMIVNEDADFEFYLKYRYNDTEQLPIKRVRQYTRACAVLRMLQRVEESRNRLIKDMGINVPTFFKHLDSILQLEKKNGALKEFEGVDQLPIKFPTSYRNLVNGKDSKLAQFKSTGPVLLIDKMYGNQLAAKVNDEVAESTLLELIVNPMQYDDVLVCMLYNNLAKKTGHKAITPATVGVWRRKKGYEVDPERYGKAAYNEKYIRQVKGLLPSSPLRLVEHDDNNLDFLFKEEGGYEFGKYVAITVIDSRTKLLLGKSYIASRTPEKWMVYHAYLDAMYYIRSLTGSWHLPFEVKADKWAAKSLTPFYNKIGKYIPPSHGNKHRGYLEQYFASPLWKRSQKLVSQNNYTGNNMTAKYRGVNEDTLRLNSKNRPMIGNEAEQQIENMFHLLRHMPAISREDMNAPSKEQQFLNEWALLTEEQKRPISDEHFLLTFGIRHNAKKPIAITNRGIEPQILNTQYSYDMPESWMYEKYRGAKVRVVYDPYDMSRVLITNDDDIRFIAKTADLSPRAITDSYTGSRTFLNALLAEKAEMVERASSASERRKKIAQPVNAANMLIAGPMVKEIKNNAEHQAQVEHFTQEYENYIDDNNDFEQFFK